MDISEADDIDETEVAPLEQLDPSMQLSANQAVGYTDEQGFPVPAPQQQTHYSAPPAVEAPKRNIHKALEPLHKRIDIVYQQELELDFQRRGVPLHQSPNARRTIRQLIVGDKTATDTDDTSTPMKLQVLQAWRELVDAMIENPPVFYDYIQNLQHVFREAARIVSPEPNSAEEAPVTEWFRQQRNLLRLLTHTVQNHGRDNSTECRFATLVEIALSYQQQQTDGQDQQGWQPSENLQRLWVRLMQRIEPTIAPVDFRRRAYGVLVSLEWVPASKGLMEACSIPDNRSEVEVHPDIPMPAKQALATTQPLPRNDSVYQVLDRLKDETGVVLALCGRAGTEPMLGIGKTVLAALVVNHPLIVQSFQLLWLRMDYKRVGALTYRRYTAYLDELLDQLRVMTKEDIQAAHEAETEARKSRGDEASGSGEGGDDEFDVDDFVTRPVWPEDFWTQRLEEPALRQNREECLMRQAKEMVSEIFEQCDKNILLVLDDASEQNEFEWFRFSDNQSILATTQSSDLQVDWKVEFDPWIEEEAIALFLSEANYPQSHVMAEAVEVKEMVSRTNYHALTVRTLARWFRLKQVSVGMVMGLEESKQEFTNYGLFGAIMESSNNEHAAESLVPRPLKAILNQALSPIVREKQLPSSLFKLAVSSMAAVFSEFEPVPLNAVLLLWERLFTMEPDALIEIGEDASPLEVRKRAWFIAEGLLHLGLIDLSESKTGEAMVSAHHEIYVKFGLDLMSEMDLGENADETKAQWHCAFAAAYLSRQSSGTLVFGCREYILQNLVAHMLRGKLFQKVATLLSSGRLYNDRTERFGRDVATELHLADCVQLLECLKKEPSVDWETHREVASNLAELPMLFCENVDLSKEENAVALSKEVYLLGFSLAEHGNYVEALNLYSHAQKLVPMTNPFAAIILYGLGAASLARHDSETALKKCVACVACMNIVEADDDDGTLHALKLGAMRLQAGALYAHFDYIKAAALFEEVEKQMKEDGHFETKIEYVALLYLKGRLHELMGDTDAAMEDFKKCLAQQDVLGEWSRVMAAAHGAMADISLARGEKGEAVKSHIERALRILQAVDDKWPKTSRLGIDNDVGVEISLLKAKLSTLQLDLSPSWNTFESTQAKISESPVYLFDQSVYDMRQIARAFSAGGEHARATAALRQALLMSVDRQGSLERARCLLDLGNSLLDQGDSVEMEDDSAPLVFFQEALEIQKQKLGDGKQVLTTLTVIGNQHVANDSHEEAADVFATSLELAKKLGSGNEEIAGILYNLGGSLESCGQHEDAESRFNECLEVLKKDGASDHPDLARPFQGLGSVRIAQGKFDEAKQFYLDALQILEANYVPSHGLIIETVESLANIELNQGEYSNGLTYLFKVLEAKQPLDDRDAVGETMFHIGCAYQLSRDHENAISYFDQSYDILKESTDENDQLMGSLALATGNSKLNLGYDDEAALHCERGKFRFMEWLKRHLFFYKCLLEIAHALPAVDLLYPFSSALEIRKSTLGEDHPTTAHAYRSVGMAKFLSNNVAQASEMLSMYVRIACLHVEHRVNVEYVTALIMLSDIQEASGKRELSRTTLSTAKDVCERDEGTVFEDEFPELRGMIEGRLATPSPATPTNHQDQNLEDVVLVLKPEEVSVFRRIRLFDE